MNIFEMLKDSTIKDAKNIRIIDPKTEWFNNVGRKKKNVGDH